MILTMRNSHKNDRFQWHYWPFASSIALHWTTHHSNWNFEDQLCLNDLKISRNPEKMRHHSFVKFFCQIDCWTKVSQFREKRLNSTQVQSTYIRRIISTLFVNQSENCGHSREKKKLSKIRSKMLAATHHNLRN